VNIGLDNMAEILYSVDMAPVLRAGVDMKQTKPYAVVIIAGDAERTIHSCDTHAEAIFKRDQLRERQAIIRQIEGLERDPHIHAPTRAPLIVKVKRIHKPDYTGQFLFLALIAWVLLAHVAGGIQ
jgi:hypothetical protein